MKLVWVLSRPISLHQHIVETHQVIIMMVVWRTIWAADFVNTDREFKMRDLKSTHLIEIYIFSFNTFKMRLRYSDDDEEETLPCHSLISL